MSGHSKWANIKHRKDAQDAKRSKVFHKIIKEIQVAIQQHNGNIDSNPALNLVLMKAKAANMSKDTVERAIKKASGNIDNANFESILYEGYGPEGSAIIVECLSDNRNRTAAAVRSLFNKYGNNLGNSNSVSYLFNKKGLIELGYETDGILEFGSEINDEKALNLCLESDASDYKLNSEENTVSFYCDSKSFATVRDNLLSITKAKLVNAQLIYQPIDAIEISSAGLEKLNKFILAVEQNEDVQEVFCNVNF